MAGATAARRVVAGSGRNKTVINRRLFVGVGVGGGGVGEGIEYVLRDLNSQLFLMI